MAADSNLETHFTDGYLGSLDFQVEVAFADLLRLLEAPNTGSHLGTIALKLIEAPSEYDYSELRRDPLSMTFDAIRRKLTIDNQVITPNTSWFRDNNRSDVISGMGELIVPELILPKPNVLPSRDGKTFALTSDAGLRAHPSSVANAESVIRAQLSLVHFRPNAA